LPLRVILDFLIIQGGFPGHNRDGDIRIFDLVLAALLEDRLQVLEMRDQDLVEEAVTCRRPLGVLRLLEV